MLRRLSIPSAVCLIVSLLAASCTYDSPSLKDAYCDQEGAIRPDDGATCTDGFWIAPPENQDANNTADTSQNACDGNSELTNPPGDACGPCGLDKYVCDGTEQTKCAEIIGCPANNIKIEATSGIDNDQATLHATIVAVDNENIPTDHGFCWFMKDGDDNPTDEKCKSLGALTKAAEGTEIKLDIDELWQGHKYFAQPYFVTPDKNDEKQRSPEGEFISFAPAPAQLTASKDQSAHVTLRWEKAKDALTYKVLRDDVPLTDIGEGTVEGTTITIKDTTATPGTLTFSAQPTASSDSYDHVSLKGSAATASAPATHKYTVIAVYPDAESAPSNEDQGQLKVGDISYRWKASAPGNDAQFDYLTTAAAAPTDYKDTQAPVDGTPRHYHLEASAPGGGTTLSNKITGNRKPVIKPELTTLAATDFTTTSVKLNANITKNGDPTINERGFCWGPATNPTNCQKLDNSSQTGNFSMPVSQLQAGTEYFAYAYVKTSKTEAKGNEIKFITKPGKPVITQATVDQPAAVTVTWQSVKGATKYHVYRDTTKIGTVDSPAVTFSDATADVPAAPSQPILEAISTPHHVELKWNNVPETLGTMHQYTVTAVNGSGEGEKSDSKNGRRMAAVTGYKLKIGSNNYFDIGNTTTYEDDTASAPIITPEEINATENIKHHVKLTTNVPTVSPGSTISYTLVAVSGAQESLPSTVTSQRAAGSITYEWHRSNGPSASNYSLLTTTSVPNYDDTSAPENGDPRFYKVKFNAEGAVGIFSTNVSKGSKKQ